MSTEIYAAAKACVPAEEEAAGRESLIHIPLLLFLLAGQILPVYALWMIMLLGCLVLTVRGRGHFIFRPIPGFSMIALILLLGTAGGLAAMWNGTTALWPVLRDFIYVSYFPLSWLLCCCFSDGLAADRKRFFYTLFVACGIVCMLSAAQKGIALIVYRRSFSAVRHTAMLDEIMAAAGFFLSLFPPDELKAHMRDGWSRLMKIFILTAVVLSLSRTVLLYAICLCIPFLRKHLGKLVWIVSLLIGTLGILYLIVPDQVGSYIEKILNSFSELNSSETVWTGQKIVNNWRGYEVACARETFHAFSPLQKLLGGGFGCFIDVHGYAYLVTSEYNLPFLHNGYYTTLIKTGIVGFFSMFLMFVLQMMKALRIRREYDRRFLTGLILALAVSSVVVSGILWRGLNVITVILFTVLTAEEEEKTDPGRQGKK